MTEPDWATKIIDDVLSLNNRTKRPVVKWYSARYALSSGVTYSTRRRRRSVKYRGWYRKYSRVSKPDISIHAGTKQSDVKGVLLHELAHWLIRYKHHHDKVFWKKAWELYAIFLSKEELEVFKVREFEYKGKAKIVYDKLFT